MSNILFKFFFVFAAGVIVAVAVMWSIPSLLTQQTKQSSKTNVLGAEITSDQQDKIKSLVQQGLSMVIDHFSQSQAVAPLVETTQSVQKAVYDVQSLPDNQRTAICQEICAPDLNKKK